MPLHLSGFVSRHKLEHPNEKDPVAPTPLNYERVLKEHMCWGRPCGEGGGGGDSAHQAFLARKKRRVDEAEGKRAAHDKQVKDWEAEDAEKASAKAKALAVLAAKRKKAADVALKYNPNHDPNTGRFTSSGGGAASAGQLRAAARRQVAAYSTQTALDGGVRGAVPMPNWGGGPITPGYSPGTPLTTRSAIAAAEKALEAAADAERRGKPRNWRVKPRLWSSYKPLGK